MHFYEEASPFDEFSWEVNIFVSHRVDKRDKKAVRVDFFISSSFVGNALPAAASKGQLISKWFFGVIDFRQKTNKRIRFY